MRFNPPDKSGFISFVGSPYEVGLPYTGYKVDAVYDLADTTELTIEYEGHAPWRVRELVIGERARKRPTLPEHLTARPTDSSRLLEAAQNGHRIIDDHMVKRVIQRELS